MKRIMIALVLGLLGVAAASGQSLDDLNIQIHGYATQAMVGTTNNNWNTTNSSDLSAAWSEAVVNITSQPTPKLRVGVQGRYFLLGSYGNAVSLDWASGDYKASEFFGIRVGKVKTPTGLWNETQDIDPSYLWSLLPQSVYPIASRNSVLAHYGAVVYGTARLGASAGKLEYRAWGGERVLSGSDGYFQGFVDEGITLPNGVAGQTYGATLKWDLPVSGLMVGVSESRTELTGELQTQMPLGPGGSYVQVNGKLVVPFLWQPYYFARYERNKVMVAGEISRMPATALITLPAVGTNPESENLHSFYGMASYKATEKLTVGAYYSYDNDYDYSKPQPSKYQRDYTFSGRYDFSSYLYAKAEVHKMSGTRYGFSSLDNPGGLSERTVLGIVKVGVSF